MRGRNKSEKEVKDIKTALALSNSVSEASEMCKQPPSTVRDYKNKFKDDPEFAEYRANKREEFTRRTDEIIFQAMKILARKLDKCDDDEIQMLMKSTELTTIIGTLVDKQKLVNNEPTEIVAGKIEVAKFEDL